MNICTRRKYESKIEKKWAEVVQENDIYDKSFSTMKKQEFANKVWAISHRIIWMKLLFAGFSLFMHSLYPGVSEHFKFDFQNTFFVGFL